MPDIHVHERHACDFEHPPEIVESLQRLPLAVRSVEAEKLEVVSLKDECQGFGERRVRHTRKRGMVVHVKREDLFDVVSHLVHRDIEALVVHPVLFHACAEARRGGTHGGSHRMAGAPGGINSDVARQEVRAFPAESQLPEENGDIVPVRIGRGISPRHDGIQLVLRIGALRTEAVVPDVEGLKRTAEPGGDQACDTWEQRGSADAHQHLFHPRLGDLPVFVEPAVDQRGGGRGEGIGKLRGLECPEQHRITRIGLRAAGDRQ